MLPHREEETMTKEKLTTPTGPITTQEWRKLESRMGAVLTLAGQFGERIADTFAAKEATPGSELYEQIRRRLREDFKDDMDRAALALRELVSVLARWHERTIS
jgi:hypothetical protein